MMPTRQVFCKVVIGLWVCGSYAIAGENLTYIDLIKRLTDLEYLAILPALGEKCAQFSSYDRASKYDETAGKYINWDANNDGGGVSHKEGGKSIYVTSPFLAEMEGPGCIWRIWSARPQAGHVKIYLDGQSEPAVDMPFSGYFDRKNSPFIYPSLVHITAQGCNCYIPIPYQKSCKVVGEQGWGEFYHFTYTTYPTGTIMPTFKRELSPQETAALEAADKFLSNNLGADPGGKRQGEVTEIKDIRARAGRTVQVIKLKGERAITGLKVKMNLASREEECQALREMILRIFWDGEKSPSVWAPLGEFFGSAPGVNQYKSLPMGMTEEGFYSYWYMPFRKSALVELTNDGSKDRPVTFTITHAPLFHSIERLGRFHAKWHRDAFLPERKDRWPDWTMLTTRGRGRYCGVMLHVWNPQGGWWGEGDEKFFIDDEKFPSTFGTGSEDYFGYAWCSPALFSNCYHNQTISMNNAGHISVNRWHITDNAPFQRSFEGAIEKYFPNDNPTLYASTVYWYLAPDGADPYEFIPVSQRLGYYFPKLQPVRASVGISDFFVFSDKAEVTLTCSIEGAEIRYTLDGSDPTINSRKYTSPIQLMETTAIKAKAFKTPYFPSAVTTIRLIKTKTIWGEPFPVEKASHPVVIDGDLKEWEEASPVVIDCSMCSSASAEGLFADNKDCSMLAYFMWDEQNLYMAARIIDDKEVYGRYTGGDIYKEDTVELWVNKCQMGIGRTSSGEPQTWVWPSYISGVPSSPKSKTHGDIKAAYKLVKDLGSSKAMKVLAGMPGGSVKGGCGRIMECAIPHATTGLEGKAGVTFRLAIGLDDNDSDERWGQLFWPRGMRGPDTFQPAVLSE